MGFISAKARLRSLLQQRGTLMNTAEPLSQCQIASHQNSTQSTTRGLESAPTEHESTTAATESTTRGLESAPTEQESTTRGLESAPIEHESTIAATESPAIGDDERLSFLLPSTETTEIDQRVTSVKILSSSFEINAKCVHRV